MPLPTAAFLTNSPAPAPPALQSSAPSRASPPTLPARGARAKRSRRAIENPVAHLLVTEPHRRESEMSLSHNHGRRPAGRDELPLSLLALPAQVRCLSGRPLQFVLPTRTYLLCILFESKYLLFFCSSNKQSSCEASY
jgi:hypothetical protein